MLMTGGSIKHYSGPALARMMKVQEVTLRTMAGKLGWSQAAEILGVSDQNRTINLLSKPGIFIC